MSASADTTIRTGRMVRKTGLIRRSLDFWLAPRPPHALAVFRILFGAYLLWYWLHRIGYVELLLSRNGMAFPYFDARSADDGGWQGLVTVITQPPTLATAWLLYILAVISAMGIATGIWTRVAVVVHWLVFAFSFLIQAYIVDTSYDRLILILLSLLAMGRSDAVYSVAAWRQARCGHPTVSLIPYWPARLIAAQIAIMYFGSGVLKILAPAWNQGEMLLYTLLGNWGNDIVAPLVGQIDIGLWDLAVLLTMLGEVYAPVFLYHRRLQKPAFVVGTVFHVAIGALLNIWPFMFMPLTYVLFIDPDDFSNWCEQKLASMAFLLRRTIPKRR